MELDIEMIQTYVSLYGLKLLAAIAIFVIGRWVSRFVTGIVRKVLARSKVDNTLIGFLGNMMYTLMMAFVVIAALSQMGVETTSLAAVIAAAGLAIGLSLQGSLSNLAAGVMIIAFRPFKAGDYVETAGTAGSIEDISIFTTTLKTPDNKVVIVPNSKVTDSNIINYSASGRRRVDMVFGIGYDDDMKKAKSILQKIVSADKRVLKDPAPVIAVSELADSSVNLVCRPWAKTSDYWGVLFDTTEAVKESFDKEGISIPYPQQDVHMYQRDTSSSKKAA